LHRRPRARPASPGASQPDGVVRGLLHRRARHGPASRGRADPARAGLAEVLRTAARRRAGRAARRLDGGGAQVPRPLGVEAAALRAVVAAAVRAMADLVYDPFAYDIHEDPYPTYRRLREEAPAYHNPERGFWALSRYQDVYDAMHDWQTYSSADGVALE